MRYVFKSEANYVAMRDHLRELGHDVAPAAVPDGEPLPWSFYCINGTCTYDAEFAEQHRGH